MRALFEFANPKIKVLFSDIDGTLTTKGRMGPEAFDSLWRLSRAGIDVVPVTGRPAGWCEMIARQWPVHGVIGENGAFYFRYHGGKMRRVFISSKANRKQYRERFKKILERVKTEVPRARLASDQFCRLFDLAIDYCEDIEPLTKKEVATLVKLYHEAGAHAKVSDIHVNGWFGDYDKRTTCEKYIAEEFGFSREATQSRCAFIGDSPNDEPLFEYFKNSFAVANFKKFENEVKHQPHFIADLAEGAGFAKVANRLIESKTN